MKTRAKGGRRRIRPIRSKNRKFRYGCPSGKRRYPDWGTAYHEMLRLQAIQPEQGDQVVQDFYPCDECLGYHHTSKGETNEEA